VNMKTKYEILLPLGCLVLLSAIGATGTSIHALANTNKYYVRDKQNQHQIIIWITTHITTIGHPVQQRVYNSKI